MNSTADRLKLLKEKNAYYLAELDELSERVLGEAGAARAETERLIDQLEKLIDEAEAEIKQLRDRGVSEQSLDEQEHEMLNCWEQMKYSIDFEDPFKRFTRLVNDFERGGALLYLLPESRDKMVDFYLKQIENWLNGGFRVATFSYPFNGGDEDKVEVVVGKIAQWLDEAAACSITTLVDKLLIERLDAGGVFYLRLDFKRAVPADFFDSFLTKFWKPLIDRMTELAPTKSGLRVLAFITVRSSLSQDTAPDTLRTLIPNEVPDQNHYIVLRLETWQRDDVLTWLEDKLRFSRYNLPRSVMIELLEGAFDQPRQTFDIFKRLDEDWKEIVRVRMEGLRNDQLASVPVSGRSTVA